MNLKRWTSSWIWSGARLSEKNVGLLAFGGRWLVQIATLGGSRATVELAQVMMKRLTITGGTMRRRPNAEKAAIAAALEKPPRSSASRMAACG